MLGSGPSLTQADVDYCRDKAVILAVKDAIRLAPWADVLYSSDSRWLVYHRGWPSFLGLKYTIAQRQHAAPTKEQERLSDWQVLRNTGDSGIETDPTGLRTGRNSGAAAINLAVHLGAGRIVLLGFDMGLGPNKEPHFYGKHPYGQVTQPWRLFLQHYAAMVQPLEALGIAVVNCSRETALPCWVRQPLMEAL